MRRRQFLSIALGTSVVLASLGLAFVAIKWGPPLLATKGLRGNDGAEELGRDRTAILATLAGLLATLGAYHTHRTFALNRAGQITERFTRAIDQLGSSELDVRLGGIYALERIGRDSRDDHPQVVEVLNAYVREHACWEPTTPLTPTVTPDPAIAAIAALERIATGITPDCRGNHEAAGKPGETEASSSGAGNRAPSRAPSPTASALAS
jgi:hypothetical protein